MTRWAISDIHGCAKTFKALLDKIQLVKEDELYLLGDYIDRGPDSKGVIDHIWHLQKEGYHVHCLRGNHEQLALNSKTDRDDQFIWLINGGDETLISFDTDVETGLPAPYLEFIENLPYFFEVDSYILVHAGLNFDIPNPFEATHSMLWVRGWYKNINHQWLAGRIIVHGHTPQKKYAIEHQLKKLSNQSIIDIDCGCVFNMKDMGHLCAFNLDTRQLVFQANVDR